MLLLAYFCAGGFYFLTETKMKKILGWFSLAAFCLQIFALPSFAASPLDIVINEVAWMGTADDSNSEWIELYNNTNQTVDLSGWSIVDDSSTVYKIAAGSISGHGYFLIEDSEVATNIVADAVIALSLANAGDSLVLKDASGNVIDTLNGAGGAWYAGDSVTKATMERIDPKGTDLADNWANAKAENGAKGRNGGVILGTPKSVNSNYGGSGAEVSLVVENPDISPGDLVTVSAEIENATDLFAYGFEISYDPAVLTFEEPVEGSFLKADGQETAFNAAFENNNEGKIVVGNVRLGVPAKGIDGSGNLFDLVFKVVGADGSKSAITIGNSFIADSLGDTVAKFSGTEVVVEKLAPVIANAKVSAGEERYSLVINWQEDLDGASTYIVKKKGPNGVFVTLGEGADPYFLDEKDLVANVDYVYQIIPVKNGTQMMAVNVSGKETRGLTGDIDHSDRVDGRDLEMLARSFGSEFGDEEYAMKKDTNYDAAIDGSDLINLGINFGFKY